MIVKGHKRPKNLTGDRQKTDIEGTMRTRNHRPTKKKKKKKTRCYGHKGKKVQNKEKLNEFKGISIDRGGVENLLRRSQPRWIENLSRICQADREHKILARWIDLFVEKLSRMQKRGFSRGKNT